MKANIMKRSIEENTSHVETGTELSMVEGMSMFKRQLYVKNAFADVKFDIIEANTPKPKVTEIHIDEKVCYAVEVSAIKQKALKSLGLFEK